MALKDDARKGFAFEVDLGCPKEIHDQHSDYPLTPESLDITRDLYSPVQNANFPKEPPPQKLTPNLFHKKATLYTIAI